MDYYFSARLGEAAKRCTAFMLIFWIIVFPLILVFVEFGKAKIKQEPKVNFVKIIRGLPVCIFFYLALFLPPYVFSPKGYTIEQKTIVIHRFFRLKITIPYTDVRYIEQDKEEEIQNILRITPKFRKGIYGIFGYYGTFYKKELGGYFKMYATDLNKIVILYTKTEPGKWVLSPENPERFVELVSKKISRISPE